MRWIDMNAIFKMCTHDLERIQISSHLLQIVMGYQKLTGPDQRTFRNNLARRHDPRSAAIADYQVVARCSKFSMDGFPAKDLHDSLKYIGMWDRIFPVRIWIPLCENGQGQVQSWDAWLQNCGTKTRPRGHYWRQLGGGLKYLIMFTPMKICPFESFGIFFRWVETTRQPFVQGAIQESSFWIIFWVDCSETILNSMAQSLQSYDGLQIWE